jgi:hypothetical protein
MIENSVGAKGCQYDFGTDGLYGEAGGGIRVMRFLELTINRLFIQPFFFIFFVSLYNKKKTF